MTAVRVAHESSARAVRAVAGRGRQPGVPSLTEGRPADRGRVDHHTREDVASIRPAGGLPPDDLELVVGAIARVDLVHGAPVRLEDIERPPSSGPA